MLVSYTHIQAEINETLRKYGAQVKRWWDTPTGLHIDITMSAPEPVTLKKGTKELLIDMGCYMQSVAMHDHSTDAIRYMTDERTALLSKDAWDRVCGSATTTGLGCLAKSQPHVPERVIYNGTTTIAIFPDGKKIKSRPDKGATFDKETGLAMCIVKHVYGTRSKFLKAIEKANDQNKEKK